MPRIAPQILRDYLLGGHIPVRGCLRTAQAQRRAPLNPPHRLTRCFSASQHGQLETAVPVSDVEDTSIAYRKVLKDAAKKQKSAGTKDVRSSAENNKDWELTVGIEIHAQLNTARKLFSTAESTISDEPNTHVALFDVAIPGSQPIFQKETLIPAIRAALALDCEIQQTSRFDRKHYFHWDQPAGYQITQYYEPFAKNGYITLYEHDGIAKEDGKEVRIGIKQIQMEQDTAKTIAQPGDIHLLDFNRAGSPLIEIITLPQIHYPSTAAALVRKIQIILNKVDACVLGMESGGLRADVNVSVRKRGSTEGAAHQYAGMTLLGQRTEIKNLSTFKSIRDAIIAERDRQISVLSTGGKIEGETRGWTLGSTETRRLRGKEGEVDYRYMPDPDLAPVVIGDDLLAHLKESMGVLPESEVTTLTDEYGLTIKDALTLVSLNDGGRAEYFYNVMDSLRSRIPEPEIPTAAFKTRFGRIAGNWVLHELGNLDRGASNDGDMLQFDLEGNCLIPASQLATIILHLSSAPSSSSSSYRSISMATAKKVLLMVYENAARGDNKDVFEIINDGDLWFRSMDEAEYEELARKVCVGEEEKIKQILGGQKGKLMYLVGKMMREGEEGRVDPREAERVLKGVVEEAR